MTSNLTWLLTLDPEAARVALKSAGAAEGLRCVSEDQNGLVFEAPRGRWYRRSRPDISALVEPHPRGTEITWNLGPFATEVRAYLQIIEAAIPVRRFSYSGIIEAALRSGVRVDDRATIRALANLLPSGEVVLALGRGTLDGHAGWVLLTNHHLTFAVGPGQSLGPALQITLQPGVSILFGKKTTGETLTITTPESSHVISGLGHSEGHLIINQARAVAAESAP